MSNNAPLTTRQSAFAQAVVEGMTYSDAYRHAYDAGNMAPATVWNNAHTLAKNPKVATRVEALKAAVQAQYMETWRWSKEKAMAEIETNLEGARLRGQMSAANGATELAAESMFGAILAALFLAGPRTGQAHVR